MMCTTPDSDWSFPATPRSDAVRASTECSSNTRHRHAGEVRGFAGLRRRRDGVLRPVRRRDGVDEPLADLFTQVAREIPSGVQGAERARSASDAFLFRRLQGLPKTRDRFRVNERLPIPFSEDGYMEVDFLDPASKVVLELDGSQHLAGREAFRRDRRKDALLQEHGYLVPRVLANDLGTRLDAVLDQVLRALARRAGGA